jgi:predicted TPR repeat methyltransferase
VDEWEDYAAGWDGDSAARAYADGAFESLLELVDALDFELNDIAVCDFGCGTGLLTERLASGCSRIDAVDTSAAMLDVLRTKIDRLEWDHVQALQRLPSTSQQYGLIVCSSVLSFVDDYPAKVASLVGHLSAGGLFVQWDWERQPDDDEPHGLLSTEIRESLEAAGLESITVGVGFEATDDGETMRPLMGSGQRST